MRPTLEDGLRALREASELAKTIRIELTEDYVRLITAVEALHRINLARTRAGRGLGASHRAHAEPGTDRPF
jgi:hypothetical protein